MSIVEGTALDERVENMVENLALRTAEACGGVLTANHLLPYLPMSLDMIQTCLDDMVDNRAVTMDESGHVTEYRFHAYKTESGASDALDASTCVACDAELPKYTNRFYCAPCLNALQQELSRLADRTGWPARAVYEHEILFRAAQGGGRVHAEDLAAKSRYTLRNMEGKLVAMSLEGRLQKDLDETSGTIVYVFPEIDYPQNQYRANMGLIRSFPASTMEEVQIRVAHILFSIGVLILGLLVLAFAHVPFPTLILLFLVIAPICAFTIWRRRSRLYDE